MELTVRPVITIQGRLEKEAKYCIANKKPQMPTYSTVVFGILFYKKTPPLKNEMGKNIG